MIIKGILKFLKSNPGFLKIFTFPSIKKMIVLHKALGVNIKAEIFNEPFQIDILVQNKSKFQSI
jgi:hypothetical protein